MGKLGCTVSDFKLSESSQVISKLGDVIREPLNKGKKRVILGKGTTGIGVYELPDIRYFSQHESKISGIIFFETFTTDGLKWMYPGRGDIVVLPKNAVSARIKNQVKDLEGHLVEYDQFSGSKIAKELYQILAER